MPFRTSVSMHRHALPVSVVALLLALVLSAAQPCSSLSFTISDLLSRQQDTLEPSEEPEDTPEPSSQNVTPVPAPPTVPSRSPSPSPSPRLFDTTLPTDPRTTCFSGAATVDVAGRGRTSMSALRVGDRVAVDGNATFSPVFLFTHRRADIKAGFTRLRTAAGDVLTVTPTHLVYVHPRTLIPAGRVRVGDRLIHASDSDATVVRVESVTETGLFNPHTLHGDILVDGFVVSTYTQALDSTPAHALLAPLRALSRTPLSAAVRLVNLDNGMPPLLQRAQPVTNSPPPSLSAFAGARPLWASLNFGLLSR